MNILGLNCLLNNIIDEQPEVATKTIRRLEVIREANKYYLQIVFSDGKTTYCKLYENEGYDL